MKRAGAEWGAGPEMNGFLIKVTLFTKFTSTWRQWQLSATGKTSKFRSVFAVFLNLADFFRICYKLPKYHVLTPRRGSKRGQIALLANNDQIEFYATRKNNPKKSAQRTFYATCPCDWLLMKRWAARWFQQQVNPSAICTAGGPLQSQKHIHY